MTHRRSLIVLAFALVLSGLAAARPSEVSACSVALPEPEDRIDNFIHEAQPTAVVVGEVVKERAGPEGFPYTSDLQVVVPLDGDPPEHITITDLGQPLECGSGHRMREGEQFLLFVTDVDPPGTRDPDRVDWRVVALGHAAYLLDDGQAALRGAFVESPEGEPVGPAEDLLRQVGDALGSDEEQVERAIAYANGDLAPLRAVPPAQTGPNPVATWGAVAIALIASAIAVGWVLRSRRARSVRGEERA